MTNQVSEKKKHTEKECNDNYNQQRYDQFKFNLMPVSLHNAFFPYISRQKFDGYIEQQRNDHDIINIAKERNKIRNQVDGTDKINDR